MSHDLICTHCGQPTPTGTCRCPGAAKAFIHNLAKAMDEPLPCGHDLMNWCDYCKTCGECRDEGKSDGGVVAQLRADLAAANTIVEAAKSRLAILEAQAFKSNTAFVFIEHLRDILAGRLPDGGWEMSDVLAPRKPLIYVAGPFRAQDRWCLERNIREAETIAFALVQAGAVALCPHSMYRNFDGTLTDQHWIDATLELLKRCDAIALSPRWRESAGARGERVLADDLGLPHFEINLPHVGGLTTWIGEWQTAQHWRGM